MTNLGSLILQAGEDVLGFEVRKVGEDLRLAGTRPEHPEHILDPDTHPSDARTASTLLRVEGDPVKMVHPGTIRRSARKLKPLASHLSALPAFLMGGLAPFLFAEPSPKRHNGLMSTVTEIGAAIEKLPPADYRKLLAWIEEHQAVVGASETLFAMYDEEEEKVHAKG